MTEIIYAGNCGECEFVLNLSNEPGIHGLCDKFGDSNFVYGVNLENQNCIYDSPGRRISPKEIETKKEKARLDEKEFKESLRKAREKIATWPEWKRNAGRDLMNRM